MANRIVRKIAGDHVFTLEESSVNAGNRTIKVYTVAGVDGAISSPGSTVRDDTLAGLSMFDR